MDVSLFLFVVTGDISGLFRAGLTCSQSGSCLKCTSMREFALAYRNQSLWIHVRVGHSLSTFVLLFYVSVGVGTFHVN